MSGVPRRRRPASVGPQWEQNPTCALMKRVQFVYGESSRVVGISDPHTDSDELRDLLILEFSLPADSKLTLFSRGCLWPLNSRALVDSETYYLRVFSSGLPNPPAPVNGLSLSGTAIRPVPVRPDSVADHSSQDAEAVAHTVVSAIRDSFSSNSGKVAAEVAKIESISTLQNSESPVAENTNVSQLIGEETTENLRTTSYGATPVSHPSMLDEDPSNWRSYKTTEGHSYYYHRKTGHSTWEKPECLKTEQEKDPIYSSQVYYENEGYDPFEDEQYFESYMDVNLHGDMVGDKVRSDAYREAMQRFAEVDFKDKVVLDCGCGTGLLSFFAVEAGAKIVYAVEGSKMARTTMEIIEANNLSEKIIVYHARIEDVQLPEKVDIIVSEWMGSVLVFESMIGSVIFARDTWLKEGGLLYPSLADLYLAPIEAEKYFSKRIDFWDTVYGIDMRAILPMARKGATEKPHFDREVEGDDVLVERDAAVLVCHMDMMTLQPEDFEKLRCNFDFEIRREGKLHGFALWFTVTFECTTMRFGTEEEKSKLALEPVVLSTAPHDPPTHWKQLSCLLSSGIPVKSGSHVKGFCEILRNNYWRRHFNFDFSFQVDDAELMEKEYGLWRYKTDTPVKPESIPHNAL